MNERTVPRVLLVAGGESVGTGVAGTLAPDEFGVTVVAGTPAAIDRLETESPELVIVGEGIASGDALDLLTRARAHDPAIGFLLITPPDRTAAAVEALRRGADDYVVTPYEADELLHAVRRTLDHRRFIREADRRRSELAERLAEQTRRIERLFLDALIAIGDAVEAREGYTGQHTMRVSRYAVATARQMGLSDAAVRHLRLGALLHDVGKIRIPDHILRKSTRLTSEEDEIMKQHPVISATIMERSELLRTAVPAILHHHERWDGGGYPYGLEGELIPIEGRILGVAEAYDAIVTPRPYRGKRTRSEAISELRRCAGAQFDPDVVDAFIRSFGGSGSEEDVSLWAPEPASDQPPSAALN